MNFEGPDDLLTIDSFFDPPQYVFQYEEMQNLKKNILDFQKQENKNDNLFFLTLIPDEIIFD